MFRSIDDFVRAWQYESESTTKMLANLTDASLAQAVGPGGRTLGRLAWHLVLTLGEMPQHAGLSADTIAEDAPQPASAHEIGDAYARAATIVGDAVREQWSDASLLEDVQMYGQTWKRGGALMSLVVHQAHHRGQMTVLMRQAGLKVPGVYGPAKEEWGQFGMTAPE